MVSETQIIDSLRKVYDPEIPVNLVDLGLIYDVSISDSDVHVRMTLTAVACPMHTVITQNVKKAIEAHSDVARAEVEIVWEPRWTPEMISPEGRQALGME